MTIGKRLKEERERLKISQTSFAEIAGVHRKSQANYETDASTPDLAYIEALKAAKIDVDVRYITEGKYTYEEIGERLRQERTLRLKLNTKLMADLGNITPELQNEYEQGLNARQQITST